MEKNLRLAFIGDPSSVEFFKVLGADIMPAHEKSEALGYLSGLDFSSYSLVLITEDVFDSDKMDDYLLQKKIMVIPSLKSNEETGYRIIETLIGKATGMKESS